MLGTLFFFLHTTASHSIRFLIIISTIYPPSLSSASYSCYFIKHRYFFIAVFFNVLTFCFPLLLSLSLLPLFLCWRVPASSLLLVFLFDFFRPLPSFVTHFLITVPHLLYFLCSRVFIHFCPFSPLSHCIFSSLWTLVQLCYLLLFRWHYHFWDLKFKPSHYRNLYLLISFFLTGLTLYIFSCSQ